MHDLLFATLVQSVVWPGLQQPGVESAEVWIHDIAGLAVTSENRRENCCAKGMRHTASCWLILLCAVESLLHVVIEMLAETCWVVGGKHVVSRNPSIAFIWQSDMG